MALLPNVGHGLLILEVSRSHITTQHSRHESLDQWTARRRDLYLTTHNTLNKHQCSLWDSNSISEAQTPHTYALDHGATGTGTYVRTFISTFVHTYRHYKLTYLHAYIIQMLLAYMHTYLHTCIHIHTYVHNIHPHIHTHIHTLNAYVHIYIYYTHTHTYVYYILNNLRKYFGTLERITSGRQTTRAEGYRLRLNTWFWPSRLLVTQSECSVRKR
jgi:hypothetical protein